jgi:hypothetical protein
VRQEIVIRDSIFLLLFFASLGALGGSIFLLISFDSLCASAVQFLNWLLSAVPKSRGLFSRAASVSAR